ncbi:MAG: hypothetical protein IPG45_01735 [Deltaproteobacteria bacterium]|nr:hypothetical protein [Deltaproteobacteria bacterium]
MGGGRAVCCLLAGIGCSSPLGLEWPPVEDRAGARSAILFTSDGVQTLAQSVPVTQDGLVQGILSDLERGERELWLYGCEPEVLGFGIPDRFLPPLSPDRDGGCEVRGAPCPLRALGLGPEGWDRIAAEPQPWDRTRPHGCLTFGLPLQAELQAISAAGEVRFAVALDPEHVLVGGDRVGAAGAFGVLELWRLRGAPETRLELVTSTTSPTAWRAGHVRAETAYVAGAAGRTLHLRRDGEGLLIEEGPRYPAEAEVCTDDPPSRAALVGSNADDLPLELWLQTGCGAILTRIEGRPWSWRRRPGRSVKGSLAWIGPGEVWAANSLGLGAFHLTPSGTTTVAIDGQGLRVTAVGLGVGGELLVNVEDGLLGDRIFALRGDRWEGIVQNSGSSYSVFLAVEDYLFAAGGSVGRVEQIREPARCPEEAWPSVPPALLIRELVVTGGALVSVSNSPRGDLRTPIISAAPILGARRCDQVGVE